MQFNANKPLSDPLIANIFDFAEEEALIPCSAVSKAFRDKVKELWYKKVMKLVAQPIFLRTFGKIDPALYQPRPLDFLREIFARSCGPKERREPTNQAIAVQARDCLKASSLALQTQQQIEQEWALNLVSLFEGVATQCKEAKKFLASLKDQALTEKGENIFLWLQKANNQAKIETIENLNLTNKSLTNLPYEIGLFKGLKTLHLDGNKLDSLPNIVGSLVNLQKLYLGSNQLTSFPAIIGSLVNLEVLGLSYNQLTSLPAAIGSLVKLERLHLTNNLLTSLPTAIGSLVRLQWLNICNNLLTSLPTAIGSLVNLQELFLDRNPLTYIPQVNADCKIYPANIKQVS